MAIRFKLVPRKDFSKGAGEDDKLLYAQTITNGTVSFDEFCESVAEESALSSADVKGWFDRTARLLRTHLREGRTVQMGELGTFMLNNASKGAPTAKEFSVATMMKRPKIQYIPSKKLKEMLDNVQYVRVKEDGTTDSGTGEDSGRVPETPARGYGGEAGKP